MGEYFGFVSVIIKLLISPDFLIVLGLVIAFFGVNRFNKISRKLFSFIVTILVVLTFFPVGEWLLYPLESKYKSNPMIPTNLTGIIMLSGGEEPDLSRIWKQVEYDRAVERNLYFLKLMSKYPDSKFVFSGGGAPKHKGYFKQIILQTIDGLAVNPKELIFEMRSKNTNESGKNLHELIGPQEGDNWVLITSASHMPRAIQVFDKYDWAVIPFPVDHQSHKTNLFRFNLNFVENLLRLKIAVKEWLGIFAIQFNLSI